MQVADRRRQHQVLIEAVQNHNPQVIVVDEIGNSEEVAAARTITERGVGMVMQMDKPIIRFLRVTTFKLAHDLPKTTDRDRSRYISSKFVEESYLAIASWGYSSRNSWRRCRQKT